MLGLRLGIWLVDGEVNCCDALGFGVNGGLRLCSFGMFGVGGGCRIGGGG